MVTYSPAAFTVFNIYDKATCTKNVCILKLFLILCVCMCVCAYGPPHMAEQKQDDQLEHTYSSYVRIRDVTLKTSQRR